MRLVGGLRNHQNGTMARRRISLIDGMTAVEQVLADAELQAGSPVFTTAVRFLLEDLAERIPGNTVEVRVPPLGATQCVQGPAHRRGTPPNVVEMNPKTWFDLAVGRLSLEQALAEALVSASGVRALEFAEALPLIRGKAD